MKNTIIIELDRYGQLPGVGVTLIATDFVMEPFTKSTLGFEKLELRLTVMVTGAPPETSVSDEGLTKSPPVVPTIVVV